jgi:hypothetical protein
VVTAIGAATPDDAGVAPATFRDGAMPVESARFTLLVDGSKAAPVFCEAAAREIEEDSFPFPEMANQMIASSNREHPTRTRTRGFIGIGQKRFGRRIAAYLPACDSNCASA